MLSWFDLVQLFATLWSVAHQDPLSMEAPNKNVGVGCLDGTTDNFRVKDLQAEERPVEAKTETAQEKQKRRRQGGVGTGFSGSENTTRDPGDTIS